MQNELVYGIYGVAAAGALVTYLALPKVGGATVGGATGGLIASGGVRRGALWTLMAIAAGAAMTLLAKLAGPVAGQVYFCALAGLTLAGAVGVVTHRRPVYSALCFIVVALGSAGMVVLAGAEFLGAALVIVYAGAILVTYVFVIFLAQTSLPQTGGMFAAAMDYDRAAREPLIAVLAGFLLVGTIGGAIVSQQSQAAATAESASAGAISAEAADAGAAGGDSDNVLAMGRLLLSPQFAVSVELAGVLLMVAMIGAIAIARRRLPHGMADSVEQRRPGEAGRHVKPF